jgi:hypothetical protein
MPHAASTGSASVASTSRTDNPRTNPAITSDSSVFVLVTPFPNSCQANRSVVPRTKNAVTSASIAVCNSSRAPSTAIFSIAPARSSPPANTSSISFCNRCAGDILFDTDVGSFLQTCSSSREPTSEPFYTAGRTRPLRHHPGQRAAVLQPVPNAR